MAKSLLPNAGRPETGRPETLAIRGGAGSDPLTGAMLPPIVQSTTYAQPGIGRDRGYTYSRVANPTVTALESALAAFEGLHHAVCFSTGMAAISGLALAVLEAGDHVVCGDVVYGGTVRLFSDLLAGFGVETSFVDAGDERAVREAVRPETKLLFVETPANPTLKLCSIPELAAVAHEACLPLVVDNTFLTAALQRPADLGADIVMYSTTKYIEGHNATVGGALLLDDADLADRFRWVRKTLGSIQSPLEAWLTLQGLKTLPLRMREHSARALEIARWLEERPEVGRVMYPWLDSFPQSELAHEQQTAGGGVVAFQVEGGAEAAARVVENLSLITLAENLGAVESLVTHPATMTHCDVPAAERRRLGIGDGVIRLSVGLEHADDLKADLEQALAAGGGTVRRGGAAAQGSRAAAGVAAKAVVS